VIVTPLPSDIMTSSVTPKLTAQNISKGFAKRTSGGGREHHEILSGIDLAVEANEFVSLIGGSGSGKTTLLRIIAGLIPADGGVIKIDGMPVVGAGRERAMVFQAINLLPWRTALRNVEYGLELQKVAEKARREAALKYLSLVGLKDHAFSYPHELSGGMRQRVGIARALATEPDVLLMDEPFASLDAQTGEFLWDELLKIVEATRKTVIFVTHHIDEAIYLSDRIVVLGDRPARVVESVPVRLRKPRWSYDVRAEAEFAALRAHLREMLFSKSSWQR
jgi:NitT/TauT family transport system ATP-binding protein